jgi:hypothetical protein
MTSPEEDERRPRASTPGNGATTTSTSDNSRPPYSSHHITVKSVAAMAWATAAMMEDVLDRWRECCQPLRELAAFYAAARELYQALCDLSDREAMPHD